MRIPLDATQKSLATLWFIGAGIPFTIVLIQTILGRYDNKSSEVWAWLLPNIVPTISLIIGVLVADAFTDNSEVKTVDRFIYRIAFFISIFYLITLNSTIIFQPVSTLQPLDLMKQSSLWLTPIQGLVSAALGAFFAHRKS